MSTRRDAPAATRLRQPDITDCDHRRHNESVAGNRNTVWFQATTQEIPISSNGILDRGRKGMFGRKAIVQRQGPAAGSPTGLGDEVSMAVERANDIAAAMQIKENGVIRSTRRPRPFGPDAVRGDRLQFHIRPQSISQAPFVNVAAALPVIVRARAAGQFFSERDDFWISHRSLSIATGEA
jgi:hypothetical protein